MSIKKTITVFAEEYAKLKLSNNRLLSELNTQSHKELMNNPYTNKELEKESFDRWSKDMNKRKDIILDEWRESLK